MSVDNSPLVLFHTKPQRANFIHTAEGLQSCIPDEVKIAYIDCPLATHTAYVRCKSCEDASRLLESSIGDNYTLSKLQGEEEVIYWKRLNESREETRTKNQKGNKHKRGTDKLIAQVTKTKKKGKKGSHIKFDNDD